MRKVLLFSGGIDSLASYCAVDNIDVLLYVAMAHRYMDVELRAAQRLVRNLGVFSKFKVFNVAGLGGFEKDDAEIPKRNLFLLSIASLFGDEIIISVEDGTEVNSSGDRSFVFFKSVEYLMQIMGEECKIVNPVADMTKGDEVEFIRCHGLDRGLTLTFSCFYPVGERECGACSACVRKYLALSYAGIDSSAWFAQNPLTSAVMGEYVVRVKEGYYRARRGEQYRKVMENLKLIR